MYRGRGSMRGGFERRPFRGDFMRGGRGGWRGRGAMNVADYVP